MFFLYLWLTERGFGKKRKWKNTVCHYHVCNAYESLSNIEEYIKEKSLITSGSTYLMVDWLLNNICNKSIKDMKRIDEIKKILVKKATGFTTGGFKPTNSDTESWIGRVYLYKED